MPRDRSASGQHRRAHGGLRDVTIPDPAASISRSHAELLIEDWQIAVTDLGSTNGTVVEAPGEAPVRLRADVPHVVAPGVRVVLGGVAAFEIVAPAS